MIKEDHSFSSSVVASCFSFIGKQGPELVDVISAHVRPPPDYQQGLLLLGLGFFCFYCC